MVTSQKVIARPHPLKFPSISFIFRGLLRIDPRRNKGEFIDRQRGAPHGHDKTRTVCRRIGMSARKLMIKIAVFVVARCDNGHVRLLDKPAQVSIVARVGKVDA